MTGVAIHYFLPKSLVRDSALNADESGKDLSDGYAVNFAVGCTHGCLFCYVDRIHRLLNPYRLEIKGEWGEYLYVPGNLAELIAKTPWRKYAGLRLLMSSTHDPYLPELYWPHKWPRRILEAALPHDVKFVVLTRSVLALMDLDLYAAYADQIELMASIPTLDDEFAKLTEPRAPPPSARLKMLRKARERGIRVGVVVAPIIVRRGWREDLERLFKALVELRPSVVFGESLHARGLNLARLERVGVKPIVGKDVDEEVGRYFEQLLIEYGLKGKYWFEYGRRFST